MIRYLPCLKFLIACIPLPDTPSLLVQIPCHFLPAFLLPLSRPERILCDSHVWDSWDLVSSVLCRISHWAMPFLTRGPTTANYSYKASLHTLVATHTFICTCSLESRWPDSCSQVSAQDWKRPRRSARIYGLLITSPSAFRRGAQL